MSNPRLSAAAFLLSLCFAITAWAKPVHHYVFFNLDRKRISESSFLYTKAFEGAQLKYTWRELEPEKDQYDFSEIRKDLAFLTSNGKKLFVQLQEASFSAKYKLVPQYLLTDEYHGGVAAQYEDDKDDENAQIGGWVARRWDPKVQERFYKLLNALGKDFDGKIEGINLPESSVGFGETGKLYPPGYSPEIYRDALIANMRALKNAFPKSVVIQYANFMPGEWLPDKDKGYLRSLYKAARELHVGVGGPDVLPFRRWQSLHSYPLIRESNGAVPIGVAVQDGNYADVDKKTGRRASIEDLLAFATEQLKTDYIFWCTEEPYYSKELVPLMKQKR
jgi:hypothetical protein